MLDGQRREQRFRFGVVAEGAADVDEQIAIAGSEDEARSELKRILTQAVLAVSGTLGAGARCGVVAAEEMEQVRRFQFSGAISGAIGIDQQRKRDAGLLPKQAGIVHVAQADGGQCRSRLLEFLLVCAQLRDMLTAENSTVVTQKHNDGGIRFPKRTQPNIATAAFRQHNVGESRTERFHDTNCIG